jgi:hypothetical protein
VFGVCSRVTIPPWAINQEIAKMTSFLSLHAAAAARGDGLRPELLALVAGIAHHSGPTPRSDGMIQAGSDPAPEVAGKPANVSVIVEALHALNGT